MVCLGWGRDVAGGTGDWRKASKSPPVESRTGAALAAGRLIRVEVSLTESTWGVEGRESLVEEADCAKTPAGERIGLRIAPSAARAVTLRNIPNNLIEPSELAKTGEFL